MGALMKRTFFIFLWCMGILFGCLWISLSTFAIIHVHRVSLRALLFLWGGGYLVYMSFRFLREELGGPDVEFKQEKPLTEMHAKKLRSLWK